MAMWPLSMVSRWFRQRKKVLLPEPEGPITATTSPRATESDTPRSTSCVPKRLRTSRASIISAAGWAPWAASSLVVSGIALLQALEAPGQHQGHHKIESGGDDERRGGEVALHNAARRA